MKQAIKQVGILVLLGAWAITAITSSPSSESGCREEWKMIFDKNVTSAETTTTDADEEPVYEMTHPGFRSFILQ